MAPFNLSGTRRFRSSYDFSKDRDRNDLLANESTYEQEWEMGNAHHVEEDIKDTSIVLRDGSTLFSVNSNGLDAEHLGSLDMSDDTTPPTPGITNFDLLGPEMESFAQCLDVARSHTKSGTTSDEAEKVSYKLIQQYYKVALKRLQEHYIAWKDVDMSTSKVDENGCEFALDNNRNWVEISALEANTRYWELETETWDLFLILCRHRFGEGRRQSGVNLPDEINHQYSSNLKFREILLRSNPSFKELNLILDWVKRKAPKPEKMKDMRGAGWTYTKEKLKSRKRLRRSEGGAFRSSSLIPSAPSYPGMFVDEDLVTELDPDAPARQGKYLEDEDVNFERKLMTVVWQHLRAGDLQGAMSKCKEANDLWRAQSLAGLIDAWDQEIDGPRDGVQGLEGNRRRELWRRMCYQLARESSDEEAAVYGVLSGDLESVLPVCQTWDDFLFAHLNSLVECHYSEFLSSQRRIPGLVEKFPIYSAIQAHGAANSQVLSEIVDNLYSNKVTEVEAHESLHIIQGILISDRMSVIVAELSRQLDMFKNDPGYEPASDSEYQGLDITDFRVLRVVVHILLILNNFGEGFAPGTRAGNDAETVIAGYIDLLAEAGKHDLIPLYAGQLSKAKATSVMGEILMKVIDEDDRLTLLRLMKNYGIDIRAALNKMMSNILLLTRDEYEKIPMPKWTGILGVTTTGIRDEKAVSKEDEMMIRALEWMLLVDDLKNEIIAAGCEIYKRFLKTAKLSSARELRKRVPSATIDFSGEAEALTSGINKITYIEFENLIMAIEALEHWKDLVHKVSDKRDRTPKADLEAAYEDIESYALPVGKSWFAASSTWLESMDELDQITSMKNAYIPDLILALHQVYIDAGKLLHRSKLIQTLELAAAVAANTIEGINIVNCFMETGRMKEYVDKLAEASRQILGAAQTGGRDITRRGIGATGGATLSIWNVK